MSLHVASYKSTSYIQKLVSVRKNESVRKFREIYGGKVKIPHCGICGLLEVNNSSSSRLSPPVEVFYRFCKRVLQVLENKSRDEILPSN